MFDPRNGKDNKKYSEKFRKAVKILRAGHLKCFACLDEIAVNYSWATLPTVCATCDAIYCDSCREKLAAIVMPGPNCGMCHLRPGFRGTQIKN